ncbi:Poly(ADP-ribose) polymerase [Macleaya cordata]|uniref:Poly(ADP-ribose) polymerase n=1 Tax=Macleaya cordata TaxID=56857 RepID=A0A200R2Q6_MACCD|nr:Poly(ADP-ribose) polymerase [Macleaya cordata]
MVNIRSQFQLSSLEKNDRRFRTSVPRNPRTDGLNAEKETKIIVDLEGEQPNLETKQVEEVSDTESCTTTISPYPKKSGIFNSTELLVPLKEDEKSFVLIKQKFLSGLGPLRNHADVVAIHKNTFSNPTGKARLQSFGVYANTVEKERDGKGNITFAWYGATKVMVSEIVNYGFTKFNLTQKRLYGYGIYLTPETKSINSLASLTRDEDGLRHLVLCRVILGNLEEIPPGREQSYPSSVQFDSGVDNLLNPTKYIVWGSSMNSHILPEYVLSFKAPPSLDGFLRLPAESVKKPTSPWLSFPCLITLLSTSLKPRKIYIIEKFYRAYLEKRISRELMVEVIRRAAGDKKIARLIKYYRAKEQQLKQQQEQQQLEKQKQMNRGWSRSRFNNCSDKFLSSVDCNEEEDLVFVLPDGEVVIDPVDGLLFQERSDLHPNQARTLLSERVCVGENQHYVLEKTFRVTNKGDNSCCVNIYTMEIDRNLIYISDSVERAWELICQFFPDAIILWLDPEC